MTLANYLTIFILFYFLLKSDLAKRMGAWKTCICHSSGFCLWGFSVAIHYSIKNRDYLYFQISFSMIMSNMKQYLNIKKSQFIVFVLISETKCTHFQSNYSVLMLQHIFLVILQNSSAHLHLLLDNLSNYIPGLQNIQLAVK